MNRQPGVATAPGLAPHVNDDRRYALDFAQMTSRPLHGSIGDEVVRDALRDLNASDQQLLLLVARERLDRDQLAALLGVSTTTISGRVHRARVRLARALAAQEIKARDRLASRR